MRDSARYLHYSCDPSADSPQAGSLIGLLILRRFAAAGHNAVALAGGAADCEPGGGGASGRCPGGCGASGRDLVGCGASSAAAASQRQRHSAASAPQALAYASVTCSDGNAAPLAAVDSTDAENSAVRASTR